MEVLLNLFWLLIALGAFARWGRRIARTGRKDRRIRQAISPLLALACALAVLFPAISVTDDLHPQLAVIEDSSATRRNVTSVGGGHGQSNHGALASPPALASAPFQSPGYRNVLASVTFIDSIHPDGPLARTASERAPPLV
jgi:hypothetical protein